VWRFTPSPFARASALGAPELSPGDGDGAGDSGSACASVGDASSAHWRGDGNGNGGDGGGWAALPAPPALFFQSSMQPHYESGTAFVSPQPPPSAGAPSVGAVTLHFPLYEFPSPQLLASPRVAPVLEPALRALGYGYRAKFVAATATIVAGPLGGAPGLRRLRWHDGTLAPAAAMEEEEEPHPRDTHAFSPPPARVPLWLVRRQLQALPGVGAKVCDCVSLFSLDALALVPVDTHIIQVAVRDYGAQALRWIEKVAVGSAAAGTRAAGTGDEAPAGDAAPASTAVLSDAFLAADSTSATAAVRVRVQKGLFEAATSATATVAPEPGPSVIAAAAAAAAAATTVPTTVASVERAAMAAAVAAAMPGAKPSYLLPLSLDAAAAAVQWLLDTDDAADAADASATATAARPGAVAGVSRAAAAAVQPVPRWRELLPRFLLRLASQRHRHHSSSSGSDRSANVSSSSAGVTVSPDAIAASAACAAALSSARDAALKAHSTAAKSQAAAVSKAAGGKPRGGARPGAGAGIGTSVSGGGGGGGGGDDGDDGTAAGAGGVAPGAHSAFAALLRRHHMPVSSRKSGGDDDGASQVSANAAAAASTGKITVSAPVYASVNAFFRDLFGPLTGWAHSLLFTADLPAFKSEISRAAAPVNDAQDSPRASRKKRTGAEP
jgi:hypothetical protein